MPAEDVFPLGGSNVQLNGAVPCISENRGDRGQLWAGCRAIASLITISDCVAQYFNTGHNSEEGEEWSLTRRSTQRFSWLKEHISH